MRSHEILREVYKVRPPKALAERVGVSESLLYKWAEPHGEDQSGAPSPLDRVAALVEASGDHRPLEWLCQQAGGCFVPSPSGSWQGPVNLMRVTTHVVQHFADLLQEIAQAAADNRITPDEARKIRKEWQDLKSKVEGFVRSCEKGDFGSMEQEMQRIAD